MREYHKKVDEFNWEANAMANIARDGIKVLNESN